MRAAGDASRWPAELVQPWLLREVEDGCAIRGDGEKMEELVL